MPETTADLIIFRYIIIQGFQGKRNDTIDRCLSLTFFQCPHPELDSAMAPSATRWNNQSKQNGQHNHNGKPKLPSLKLTDIAPENRPSQKGNSSSKKSSFWDLAVSFREGPSSKTAIWRPSVSRQCFCSVRSPMSSNVQCQYLELSLVTHWPMVTCGNSCCSLSNSWPRRGLLLVSTYPKMQKACAISAT